MSSPHPSRILVVADLHSWKKILAPLRSTVERLRPDAVFCLGDLTIPGPSAAAYTEAFLEAAGANERPVLYVSGNNDDPDTLRIMRDSGSSIDWREYRLGSQAVVGVGYYPPETPFAPKLGGSILLTHVPPRREASPPPLGNAPRFHFSGHIHKLARTWMLGGTTVVQVPSAMDLRAAVLTLPEGSVEFISLDLA